ncbi:AAA family ATPase [Sneathiella chungangensis]|uniref:AAA family ATPase n=1 Tax=Sneathiella chungangensis TaxID=1418234 RepID=A0A845MLL7_9PROT|nr:AAA family ATPase [Sneathiella chungangensis]MZR24046.1 AAA family ATPase [Sneathiella chungangensis]
MKISKIEIHNFRSIIDAVFHLNDYNILVGPNNAGKSAFINAIRAVYEDYKFVADDFPKTGARDKESWVEITYKLQEEEWAGLADKYKIRGLDYTLKIRRYFKSSTKDQVKSNQTNIYGYTEKGLDTELFYGAKNISAAKIGEVIYVPALTTISEQTKMSGPSPLRNMLNFLLKKMVEKSDAYKGVTEAFEKFNQEAKAKSGFLNEVASPINSALSDWQIQIDLSVDNVKPEDITKSLISYEFVDLVLQESGNGFELERYGHGFQRSVIYELIRLAPTFKDVKSRERKDFNPDFTLILFEEPEAFLHPSQQENMAINLRKLGAVQGQQIIITTHSPTFVGKAAEDIGQIGKMQRTDGITKLFQPSQGDIQDLFEQGGNLLAALRSYIDDPNIEEDAKREARRLVANPPQEEIALQEEKFRYQLWLDGERSSMFFADRVLLVEGATERALFNYLLADDWHDLTRNRIYVVDVLGKFNFHRYMGLLTAFGISHGVLLDDDDDRGHHYAINRLVSNSKTKLTLSEPVKFSPNLEGFLGLDIPGRNDMKPIEILKAITGNQISEEKQAELKQKFKEALAITD